MEKKTEKKNPGFRKRKKREKKFVRLSNRFKNSLPDFRALALIVYPISETSISTVYADPREQAPFRKRLRHFFMSSHSRFERVHVGSFSRHVGSCSLCVGFHSRYRDCCRCIMAWRSLYLDCTLYTWAVVASLRSFVATVENISVAVQASCVMIQPICVLLQPLCGLCRHCVGWLSIYGDMHDVAAFMGATLTSI